MPPTKAAGSSAAAAQGQSRQRKIATRVKAKERRVWVITKIFAVDLGQNKETDARSDPPVIFIKE